ncbi:MerR family transcriptional regulator [Modestobacter sp. I12A-02628]|uniref:MerR family transcriptional regulator n=1 Tax=Goekera deserti TaxID=2497753 RepID=A0A7K3WCV7_9ACTN|nr:HEAT repeat domain-containing protein [Goekera deserti]MPQ96949.1 MerR family transcriptional regulator [Goekera deserti]NDI46736.1 MerR family transcriptional regulator [Goekera deserti]NEL54305.1 MerR family transcriptional regulator [Goekera deserti]
MRIGEVAARSGISTRMLRYYDSVGLVSPSGRTSAGYRQYRDDDLRRLFHVEALRALGLTLQEVATALEHPSFSAADTIEAVAARIRERLAKDEELLRGLAQVRASGPVVWSDVLQAIGLVRGLGASSPSARQRTVLSLREQRRGHAALLAQAAVEEADPHVGGALRWALARSGDDGLQVLVEALRSPAPEPRRRAVEALTKIGTPAAVAALAAAVGHPDPHVSGRAALVCGAHGDLTAVPRLVALVVEGRDDVEAATVLGRLAARHDRVDTITAALGTALEDADDAARRRVAAALADLPGPSAAVALAGLATDPDPAVALTATAVLRGWAGRGDRAGGVPSTGS